MKSSESTEQPAQGPLRIGILQADWVLDEFQGEFGDYPAMFARLLESANLTRATPRELVLETYVAINNEFPEVCGCDAYLITGSRHSVYDDAPWIHALVEFVVAALAQQRKIIGICFGHQLLAHYFGGETRAASAGWSVGVQRTQLLCDESWMTPSSAEIGLLSSHKDQVLRMPEGARRFASSDSCPTAGFVMGERVLALQGHPEFSKGYSAALMQMRRELLGEATYQRGMASLSEDTHEDVVGRWILNFVEGI